jgi:hypothetical protein
MVFIKGVLYFSSDFIQSSICFTDFSKNLQYEILKEFFQFEPWQILRTDGQRERERERQRDRETDRRTDTYTEVAKILPLFAIFSRSTSIRKFTSEVFDGFG